MLLTNKTKCVISMIIMEWNEFININNENSLGTRKEYVYVFGDLATAHLLSQIIFWFSPGKNGQSKLRVRKDGKEWIAKKREDWWDECCITKNQFDRSIKILKKYEIVETKIFKFNGEPTTHIWLNKDKLLEVLYKK